MSPPPPQTRVLLSAAKTVARSGASINISASCRSVACHSLTLPSQLPLAMVRPSGEKPTAQTTSLWPLKLARSRPLSTSHSRTVWSVPPVTRVSPSGANARHLVEWALNLRSLNSFQDFVSQNRTSANVLFGYQPTLAKSLPPGANARATIGPPPEPFKEASLALLVTFQISTSPSTPPQAKKFPSGEKDSETVPLVSPRGKLATC